MRAAAGDVAGILCLFSVAAALDFKYHHAEELEAYLKEVHAAYPSFTHLHSIGRSVEVSGVLARYKNRMRRLYIAQCTLSYVTGSLPLYHEGHGLHLWEIVTLQSLFTADLMIHKDLGNNTFYGTAYSSTYILSCRDLWVLVLGRFPTHHKIGIPEFKYVANMHGDETVGREILLHLIDFLVTSYRRDPVITRLLNNTRIHIMPTMNPDGFEATKVPDCYYTPGRYNKNGEDLNRNFPDAFESNNASIQPETQAVMDWIKNETFVLSANLHGGALVASYTFDNGNSVTGSLKGYSRSPDDDVFIHLAKTYSFNHASMYKGIGCDNRQTFPEGITNGYSWYQLEGGMQDYNYIWGQCFEITLELSCCKYPPANQLEKFWRDNKAALIEYMKQVHLGVKGQVTGKNGTPIPNAIVEAKGRAHVCPYRTNQQGEYFLLLLPGTYVINATVPGFKSMLKTVEIPDNTGNFSALKQDFFFSEVSIKPEVPSCPKIPLYQELDRASAAVKPTLHILGLMTVMLVIFK